ncbi:MAG TPA: isopentenyl transferase family protein, partial [Candidatus Sulfotelmatobacter sp.]|nr:isopentenyl transferase family protein [Candidatus Sulfotelmatobacter sp.]
MARKLTPLVVIVGPTCSGKSGLGMKLAEYFNGEIICADSWTVRKGVDIGTAKPTPQDRRSIKHHLLDVIEPDAMFNAAEFKKLATKAIADISNRGKLPIMVGGSGLYIDGLLYNYSFLPPSKLRKKLNTLKLEELIKRADKLNLINTSIDLNNRRHLIRLIEANGDRPTRNELRSNTL